MDECLNTPKGLPTLKPLWGKRGNRRKSLNTPKGLPTLKLAIYVYSLVTVLSQYPEGPTYFKTVQGYWS